MDKLQKILNNIPKYVIEIGVIAGDSKRKETLQVGVTNAELMFIHEEGSPANHIPKRPVLHMTVEWAKKNLLPSAIHDATIAYLNTGSISEYEKALNVACVRMEEYAKDIIYSNDGRLKSNAPETAEKKWRKEKGNKNKPYPGLPAGNHPLFDTGQLARSITCQLKRI